MAALLAGFWSCNTIDPKVGNFEYAINLDNAEEVESIDISEFCDDVQTIVLETTEGPLLSSIDKIICANSRLYVFDRRGRVIAEFDMDGKFIRRYALFSDKYSNEVFKVTPEGVTNYISLESQRFMGEKEREIMSEAWNVKQTGTTTNNANETLFELDCFRGIWCYFETNNSVFFMVARKHRLPMFIYNKENGKTINPKFLNIDSIVKEEYKDVHMVFNFLQADSSGIFYRVNPGQPLSLLRTAAREGMLVDNLDKLEELKQLEDNSNPVLFYLTFK